jgi:hypothetical protein
MTFGTDEGTGIVIGVGARLIAYSLGFMDAAQ